MKIKDALFDYVKNPETWFYWYHNPERLKTLYEDDTKDKAKGSHIPTEDYVAHEIEGLDFTKKTGGLKKANHMTLMIKKNFQVKNFIFKRICMIFLITQYWMKHD